jgi:hypothetical protein
MIRVECGIPFWDVNDPLGDLCFSAVKILGGLGGLRSEKIYRMLE